MLDWFALMLGNSRAHYAHFQGRDILQTWNGQHELPEQVLLKIGQAPLVIASVVPQQSRLWQSHPNCQIIELKDVKLKNSYPGLGVDRALALLGVIAHYGPPAMVIDAGTALTISGVDASGEFVGGAILPGLGLQLKSLYNSTGALPLVKIPQILPAYWANSTSEAIQSGIIHFVIAGIKDFIEQWQSRFGQSHIVFTGGDGEYLYNHFRKEKLNLKYDPNLVFMGIRELTLGSERRSQPDRT